MYDVKFVTYKGHPIRLVWLDGEWWWSLCDVYNKVLGYSCYHNIANKKLRKGKSRTVLFVDGEIEGYSKLRFINKTALREIVTETIRSKLEDFLRWIESECVMPTPTAPELLSSPSDETQDIPLKKKVSVAASIQKAQMLIRVAEHKAIPHAEQLRLLNLAVQELTGTGLKIDLPKLTDDKPIQPDSDNTEQPKFDPDIMKLPEVIGYAPRKRNKKIGNQLFTFYTAADIGEQMQMSAMEFNQFANRHNLKNVYTGIWERVMTPHGEAREFMYIYGVLRPYIFRNSLREPMTA